MKYAKSIFILSAISFFGMAYAQTPKVTCTFNSTTKQFEPTKAWKDLLGDEAFGHCQKLNNVNPSEESANRLKTTPTSRQVLPSMPKGLVQTPQATALNSTPAAPVQAFTPPTNLMPIAQVQSQSNAKFEQANIKKTMAEERSWKVELKDITLSTTFARWANDAGYRIRWDSDKNVIIDAPDIITGSFEDAVGTVLSSPGITESPYPLEVCFYANTPPLARITRKGEQKDCK